MNRSADFVLGGGPPKNKKQSKKSVPVTWKERLSAQDYQQLRDIFLIFDEDGSGKIDTDQIIKAFEDMGLNTRNQLVEIVMAALRQKNKSLDFQQFVDCVCSKVGQYRTRDGLQRTFALYDRTQKGTIGFQQLKAITRAIGQNMNDQSILDLMHSTFIKNNTHSNQQFTFDEFYQVISTYYSRVQK